MRLATHAQNQRNQRKRRNAVHSRFKGVTWATAPGKWLAQIQASKKHFNLGLYESEESAARAYDSAAVAMHGAFAHVNFPEERPEPYVPKRPRRPSSGISGVFRRDNGMWQASATINGTRRHLGTFRTKAEAARARAAEIQEG